MGYRETERQIKAPRVVPPEGAVHRKVGYESWFIKEPEKNNELKRTETNSGSVSYGVRTSSLLIFFIFGRIYRKAQPQYGKEKAGYGKALIKELSEKLTKEYGRGLNERNLWHIRSFYLTFPKVNALRSELSWTHYRFLLQTGLTGSTGYVFNPVHPVILSNLKCQLLASRQSAMVEVG